VIQNEKDVHTPGFVVQAAAKLGFRKVSRKPDLSAPESALRYRHHDFMKTIPSIPLYPVALAGSVGGALGGCHQIVSRLTHGRRRFGLKWLRNVYPESFPLELMDQFIGEGDGWVIQSKHKQTSNSYAFIG
jgi:hypothetical protein